MFGVDFTTPWYAQYWLPKPAVECPVGVATTISTLDEVPVPEWAGPADAAAVAGVAPASPSETPMNRVLIPAAARTAVRRRGRPPVGNRDRMRSMSGPPRCPPVLPPTGC